MVSEVTEEGKTEFGQNIFGKLNSSDCSFPQGYQYILQQGVQKSRKKKKTPNLNLEKYFLGFINRILKSH